MWVSACRKNLSLCIETPGVCHLSKELDELREKPMSCSWGGTSWNWSMADEWICLNIGHLKIARSMISMIVFSTCSSMKCQKMEVSWNGGTPSHHTFRTMGFSFINNPLGVPPIMEAPINRTCFDVKICCWKLIRISTTNERRTFISLELGT